MVVSYSPHRDAGGTLHFPSPTHIHHVDTSSALRKLRRSLSRSPSKGPTFRLVSAKSPSPSPKSHLSSSPLSPTPRSAVVNLSAPSFNCSSPLAVPFPPSARIHRPGARRATPMRPSSMRTSPRSPMKRALSDSTDHGNAAPTPSASFALGGENRQMRSISSPDNLEGKEYSLDEEDQDDVIVEDDSAPEDESMKLEKTSINHLNLFSTIASPLKRGDGIMDMDRPNLGSPVAKRRSVHGASFISDFNVFEPSSPSTELRDEAAPGIEMGQPTSPAPGAASPFFSSLPKRSTSLRKSTLQQRHFEKPLFARSRPNPDLALDFPSVPHSGPRNRLPVMADSSFPPMSRDSPFYPHGNLPSASVHAMPQTNSSRFIDQPSHQPHPLSKEMTASSASPSLEEDSPTHVPVSNHDRAKKLDFSRSLPVGIPRPFPREPAQNEYSQAPSDTSFATPQNYKLVKPLPAAFMSTGLISKRNRNLDDQQAGGNAGKAQMPDTPCKRPINFFAAAPVPMPGSALGKSRQSRPEFGTPSTPFNLHASRQSGSRYGAGVSIFGSNLSKGPLARRDSFASIDGEEFSQSPAGKDGQSNGDYDLPPTPTKQVSFGGSIILSPKQSRFTKTISLSPASPLSGRHMQARPSPCTPHENVLPPDPSSLSISARNDAQKRILHAGSSSVDSIFTPATPTAPKEQFPNFRNRRSSITPINGFAGNDVDPSLTSRFTDVELIGTGEFSQVYRVTQPPPATGSPSYFSLPTTTSSAAQTPLPSQVWAVKKARQPYAGPKDRQRKLKEVNVLRALGKGDHIVQLIDSWEEKNHLYIQTEFCEEGSLDLFLSQVGRKARLDDFRIWKILLELSLGLKHVHDSGFIHLDLKPANVLITFEGVLKIGDFGMATAWPAAPGIEGEGDREYIGPEILMGQYDKPADVFALGLIMLEIAGNVELPDNGISWQKLRSGDMSDVPSLTWSSGSQIFRDSSGNPLSSEESFEDFYVSDSGEDDDPPAFLRHGKLSSSSSSSKKTKSSLGPPRSELLQPPMFMVDPNNEGALDRVVRWMISPQPGDRPVVDQILSTVGVQWTEARRRAGATVFEGNWGPADDVLTDDAEMIDV
ncbi:kinase-like protein [Xylona heveae TC161]|uniref:Kinase-like protein n=1 Tax=Xylona heveae (strain CBS 132557 / TC161) TaxID=1328760 RepID=A0A165A819_XYLHT|nr:kinase-like protein [Xylona heveae TC161]KZF20084.1 kinase-like protein [Xylona heveae TC161]